MTSEPSITTDVHKAAEVLRNGGIIGLPTETVYGLAALASDEVAVRRVFTTKGRPESHPLIVHLGTNVNPEDWGVFNADARALAKAFWPGPLTLLLPRTSLVSDWVTGGRNTVALRVPSHRVAQALLNEVGSGVVAPSANRFGKVSPTTAEHVLADLGTDVDLILDGGPSQVGLESTIVECINNTVRILRPGVISEEDLRQVTNISDSVDTGDSRAPGMLASHYAPSAQVLLFDTLDAANAAMNDLSTRNQKSQLLHYEDIEAYAENLYADLRYADLREVSVVCAVLPTNSGLGVAIRDRLRKAAHV
jgi:L-threonylcarbamoyladenylate synthase